MNRALNTGLLGILFCFFSILGFSQNHEVSLNYRIGIPTSTFQVTDPTFENNQFENQYTHRQVHSQFDHGAILLYKWKFWNRFKLFLSGGVEVSSSKHYQPLIDPSSRLLENIRIKNDRIAFHIGLNKQFEFYDSKVILDIGLHVVDRYSTTKTDTYSKGLHFNNEDWIEYSYDLKTYKGRYYENNMGIDNKKYMYINLNYSLNLMFRLMEGTFLNLGASYTRNNIFFYDYQYSINYYTNGSTTPTSTVNFEGLDGNFDPKYGVRDHFLYFNVGLLYKFNWKKTALEIE